MSMQRLVGTIGLTALWLVSEAVVGVVPCRAQPPAEGDRPGAERSDNGLGMKLVRIPPGEFLMGSPQKERGRGANEDPVRVVIGRGFWVGRTEITRREWASQMKSTPWKGRPNAAEGESLPATHVRWDDAAAFCRALTESEREAGRLPRDCSYRLPTEAEWEFACRAGSPAAFSFGDDARQLGAHAWYAENLPEGKVHPQPVGTKSPNPWGLADMHGNVWEWCSVKYGARLVEGRDPHGPERGAFRSLRGGGWNSPVVGCRSAIRSANKREFRSEHVGFRVVLTCGE